MPRKTLIGLVGSLALWMSGILGGFALLQKYAADVSPSFVRGAQGTAVSPDVAEPTPNPTPISGSVYGSTYSP